MSELSSLYCKVKITKSQLENFLSTSPEKPELNNNWLDWWESREMYSKMDLTIELLRSYTNDNNQDILKDWQEYKESLAFSDYDETAEEWHWGMIFFSENYIEMLPMFAFIISMENYLSESSENIAVVFPFFWGDSNVHAFITFEDNKAILSTKIRTTDDVNPALLDKAKEYLNKKWDDLSKDMEVD
ncbi:hypothetical protein GKZ90_0020200 [Flavobacterium sp. MC2016-06]|jgi:hypothetical protein|uniref:hypothetical protein n=1 Tax=Flavobacterium sp. MC2016-06 TaxID=2676308 RepID=UPI0012BA8A56|nr:hypothetical protein [Flavobacterium sp. MC2016-06]MBU3860916.1 hypothetical protein [Flavobacterium sp. MC2016-06]